MMMGQSQHPTFGKLKILIVDDHAEVRVMVKDMLSELGITQIYEAADGREALDFLDEAPEYIDLIICDLNMPRLSGMEFLRQVRSIYANIPFMMLTGHDEIQYIREAKHSGVSAYIIKPISFAQLQSKLSILHARMQ
jgi:two-component system chemotaxis response regulator CheY